MEKTKESTKIYKSYHHGWTGETKLTVNGQDFEINTMKRSSGFLYSNAQECQIGDNGNISFMMFQDKSHSLINVKIRVTEKAVKEQHAKALIVFDEMIEAGTIEVKESKKFEIKVGQIIFTHGYEHEHKRAIYEIESGQFGKKYKTVELKNLNLRFDDHIRPFTEKFGIGVYYNEGETIETNELNNLVIEAKQKQVSDKVKKDADKLLLDAETSNKIKEGKKLVNIPSWAKCVIVADEYVNDSDGMTDYFNAYSKKVVYLSFSKTTRNNMPELQKAALKFEPTKEFPNEAKFKYTDGHHLLPNYYFGSESWSGWKVNKDAYFDLTNEDHLNMLYIAAAENRYLMNEAKEVKELETSANDIKIGDITILEYSEKAIIILGDTKHLKDELFKVARWNRNLTHPETGEKVGAWIASKKKQADIEAIIS